MPKYNIQNKLAKVLIIAGSDSGAGAGIQADIKTVMAMGGYATTVITSVTAQNTVGVQAVSNMPIDIIRQQISSVLSDIGGTTVKTGMLSSPEIIELIAAAVNKYKLNLILDPVMISKSGAKLMMDEAIEALKNKLIPKAYLITPNIPEAEVISGMKITNEEDMVVAAKKIISEYKCTAVLMKGGHLSGEELVDVLVRDNGEITKIRSKRIKTNNTHGTGCTYSSAIATLIASGMPLEKAFKKAHTYVYKAIKKSRDIGGKGHGPVNHSWNLYTLDAGTLFKRFIYLTLFIISFTKILIPMIQEALSL